MFPKNHKFIPKIFIILILLFLILLIFLGLRDYGVGFINLTDFTSQYTGEWNPSEGHWFGLDFTYKNITYRLNTGNMYTNEEDFLFGLYIKTEDNDIETNQGYKLLFSCNSMEDLLNSTAIDNTCFRDIIINKDVELLGQD